jgi:HEAT repeat protein
MKYAYCIAMLGGLTCTWQAAADELQPLYKGKPLSYWLDRVQKAESDTEQSIAANAISAFGTDAKPAIPKLIEMLDDRSEEFRTMILGVLRGLGPHAKSAVPQLVKLLKERKAGDPEVVMWVLQAIGPDAKEAIPVLMDSLHDEKLLKYAVQTLCSIGPEAKVGIPEIRNAIKRARGNSAISVASLVRPLSNLGTDVVPLLIECLKDDPPVQCASADALAAMGQSARDAIPDLKKLVRHKTPEVRFAVANALWEIAKDSEAITIYCELLSVDQQSGYDSRRGVSELHPLGPTTPLGPSLFDRSVEALGKIGPAAKAALPALKEFGKPSKEGVVYYLTSTQWSALEVAIKKIEPSEAGK